MPSNFYLNRNIPQEAHDVMGDLATGGHELRWVAFAPGGGSRFSIVTDQSFFNRNIPQECHDQMVDFLDAGQQIVCVAFSPEGGNRFSIVTDHTFFNRNIPEECHEQMVSFLDAGQQIRCVAFPAEGGDRFSIVTDQTFFNRNIPQECHDHMVELRDGGHDILAVAFPPQGGNRYSIITDRGFVNRNVPGELHDRMNLFLCARAPFRCVAFDSDGNGWSLLAGGPSASPRDDDEILDLTGTSQMTNSGVPALTLVSFNGSGNVENLLDQTATASNARFFLTARGGWAYDLGDLIADNGDLLGTGPTYPGGSTQSFGPGVWGMTAPVTNWLLRLEASAGRGRRQDSFAQFPIAQAGSPTPAPLPTRIPVMIGLQEPLEAMTISPGNFGVVLVGQLVNGSSRPITLRAWHLKIEGGGQVFYDEDLLETFAVANHPAPLIPFLYGIPLSEDFVQGTLTISGFAEVGGVCLPIHRSAPLTRVQPDTLAAPVVGRWKWGNGPGEMVMHPHYGAPEQRYAYDLVMLREVDGQFTTFDGDDDVNPSFFCWNQPILAVDDGVVVQVIDSAPDNFGRTFNNANSPPVNNLVIIQHPGNRYSLYAHLRQGTAEVAVGQTVSTGQRIGRVGNAGTSSEPHLHFDYRTVDPTGRAQGLPMRFMNLTDLDGNPVVDVPLGNREYLSYQVAANLCRGGRDRGWPRRATSPDSSVPTEVPPGLVRHACCPPPAARGGLALRRPRGRTDVTCGMAQLRIVRPAGSAKPRPPRPEGKT